MSETSAYILNAVQTPAAMEAVYRSIDRGHSTDEAIADDTALGDELRQQGLTGLQVVGLIGRQEPDYYTVDLPWRTGDDSLDFRMAVLHELAVDADESDWGKQSVVLLNYQYLLQKERQSFKSDDATLYNKMNSWQRQDRGYAPRSQQGEIDLNQPKFVNWTRLAEHIGLIYKASGRQHTTYPDPELIYQSLRMAVNDVGNDGRVTIDDYVEWLRENLLLVTLTGDRNVPEPLARILFNLVRDGRIRIVERGDVGAVGLNGVPRREGIDKEANSIEVVA